jgi:outer membrane protein assembly factor BamB
VAAYRLEEQAGKWQLTPAWLSRDMDLAEEVVVAGGVAFAYAAGEDATQTLQDAAWNEPGGPRYGGGLSSGSVRALGGRYATLHALDAITGKELWSSGKEITSWNHFSGLTVANGRAYVATFDGTLYCFGVARPAGAR